MPEQNEQQKLYPFYVVSVSKTVGNETVQATIQAKLEDEFDQKVKPILDQFNNYVDERSEKKGAANQDVWEKIYQEKKDAGMADEDAQKVADRIFNVRNS